MEELIKTSEILPPGGKKLLTDTTLGSSGGKYQLLSIDDRLEHLGPSKHVYLQRKGKVLANVTFCQRKRNQYVRFFAFDKKFQSSGLKRNMKESWLKKALKGYFDQEIKEGTNEFYAYIDPNNERSLWMSEVFNFKKVGTIVTQTFSRLKPKSSSRVKLTHFDKISDFVKQHFETYPYFYEQGLNHGEWKIIYDEDGITPLVVCRFEKAAWKIERLPGSWGGLSVKALPYIPVINKILHPDPYAFVVADNVICKPGYEHLVSEIFENELFVQKRHVLHWWVDQKEPLLFQVEKLIKWGPLFKLMGAPKVSLVSQGKIETDTQPSYVVGTDFC